VILELTTEEISRSQIYRHLSRNLQQKYLRSRSGNFCEYSGAGVEIFYMIEVKSGIFFQLQERFKRFLYSISTFRVILRSWSIVYGSN